MSKQNGTKLATRAKPLAEQLQNVHPIHAVFIQAFVELGGEERFRQWADENYGDYVKILSHIAPRPQLDSEPGKIQISIHPSLNRTALDG